MRSAGDTPDTERRTTADAAPGGPPPADARGGIRSLRVGSARDSDRGGHSDPGVGSPSPAVSPARCQARITAVRGAENGGSTVPRPDPASAGVLLVRRDARDTPIPRRNTTRLANDRPTVAANMVLPAATWLVAENPSRRLGALQRAAMARPRPASLRGAACKVNS